MISVFIYLCILLFIFLNQEKLSDWISELQGRSENIEDLVSELELAYNSVEVKQADFVYLTISTIFIYFLL